LFIKPEYSCITIIEQEVLMNLNVSKCLWILCIGVLSCYYPRDTASGGTEGGEGTGGISLEPSPMSASSSSSSVSVEENEKTDEGFDPCPSDVYVLLEKDGVKYYVVIEVFCDPVLDLNLGCPEPY
jgi:hypothetical protein